MKCLYSIDVYFETQGDLHDAVVFVSYEEEMSILPIRDGGGVNRDGGVAISPMSKHVYKQQATDGCENRWKLETRK